MNKEGKQKAQLEYVLIDGNDNNELWEIDYDNGRALDVSEVVKLETIKSNLTRYSGRIEDFLIKERRCKNIHPHNRMVFPERIHTKSCTFDINKNNKEL
jgi:hypothetical protein